MKWHQKLVLDRFLVDSRALALFRIGLGLLIFVDRLLLIPDVEPFYSTNGWCSAQCLHDELSKGILWSANALTDNYYYQLFLVVLTAVAGLCFALGVLPRPLSILIWILICSSQIANKYVGSAGDGLLRLILFWNMFLPHGRKSGAFCNLATIGFILQVYYMYFFGAVEKSDPGWWRDGNALYYALNQEAFVSRLGLKLVYFPTICKLLTLITFYLELFGPVLLLLPFAKIFRRVIPFIFILFHFGMLITLELGLFPYVCILCWVLIIPKEIWDKFWPWKLPTKESQHKEFTQSIFAQGLCGIAAVTMTLQTLFGVGLIPAQLPSRIVVFNDVFQLWQSWKMFAPHPGNGDGWPSVQGYFADGTKVELLCGGGKGGVSCDPENRKPFDEKYPENLADLYRNSHWKKFLVEINLPALERFRPAYLNYLCDSWNKQRAQKLTKLDLVFTYEFTQPSAEMPKRHSRQPLGTYYCKL